MSTMLQHCASWRRWIMLAFERLCRGMNLDVCLVVPDMYTHTHIPLKLSFQQRIRGPLSYIFALADCVKLPGWRRRMARTKMQRSMTSLPGSLKLSLRSDPVLPFGNLSCCPRKMPVGAWSQAPKPIHSVASFAHQF